MRVMVVVKATPESETGVLPEDPSMFIEMGKFNDELITAGVMLDGAGLKNVSRVLSVERTAVRRSGASQGHPTG